MRRIPTLYLLLLCAVLLLTGCDALGQAGRENGTSCDAFYRLIDDCRKEGDRFSRLLMDETASYFYGFAGASVSAMRLAVERILWLKGEGDDFESLAAGSRCTDWDEIAEICFASPYPYYFEGLIHDVMGEAGEAAGAYANAAVMTNYPEEGLNFYYLKDLSVDELYALRDELREKETAIYTVFSPVITGYERSVAASVPEYLFYDAMALMEAENYKAAMVPARYAVRFNPKCEEFWDAAVTAAMFADEGHQAAVWLEEALRYFPESESLGALVKAMTALSEDPDIGGEAS